MKRSELKKMIKEIMLNEKSPKMKTNTTNPGTIIVDYSDFGVGKKWNKFLSKLKIEQSKINPIHSVTIKINQVEYD